LSEYYKDANLGGVMWVCGLDWAGTGLRQVAHACECCNEPFGFRELRRIS